MNINTSENKDAVAEHTGQWLEKAVIGLNLCPFAKAPHVKNLVRIAISEAKHLDGFLEDLDEELQRLGNTPATELETTLLVHPTLFPDFDVFNDMLDIADAAVVENGLEGIVQIAPFHPDFQFEGTDSDDIGNYTNRSPYPTLHLIREDSIAKAAQAFPDASAIFERNIALLEKWDMKAGQNSVSHPALIRTIRKIFQNDTLSFNCLRLHFPTVGYHRHFFAAVADHAVRTALRRLLGKGIPALLPLAAPAPLFRPDGS